MDTNLVLAIMATGALIISTLSFIVTMKFNKWQIEHNRNCLRPICSIYLSTYENFISVRIENNGTGPLILKNIKCVHKSEGILREADTLYELLPEEIKRKEFHRVTIRNAPNWTVSVNGKKYLLAITLEDDLTRQKLKHCLKDII